MKTNVKMFIAMKKFALMEFNFLRLINQRASEPFKRSREVIWKTIPFVMNHVLNGSDWSVWVR